jgi:hypothetical protein
MPPKPNSTMKEIVLGHFIISEEMHNHFYRKGKVSRDFWVILFSALLPAHDVWMISNLFENLPRYSKRISVPYWCQRHRWSIFTCLWVTVIFRFWIDAPGIGGLQASQYFTMPHKRRGYSRLWCLTRVGDLASPVSPCIGEACWHRRDSNISPQIFEKLCFDKHSH